MKQKRGKRIISLILSVVMVVSLPQVTYAMESTAVNNTNDSLFSANETEINDVSILDGVEVNTGQTNPKNPTYNETTDTATYDCVYFGAYPQSEVKGSALTDAIKNATYTVENDYTATVNGVKYLRLSKNMATFATNGISGYFDWSDNGDHYFKYESIKWRVLQNDGTNLFLLAETALDDKKYNDTYSSITWENCTLRNYLNKEFYARAFNSNEQNAIKQTLVVNENNPEYGTAGGNDTTDKVFLLSIKDMAEKKYGFSTDYNKFYTSSWSKSTDYAKAMGTYTITVDKYNGNCWWWLRSPGDYERCVAHVDDVGVINRRGNDVNYCNAAVRPVLSIPLSSTLWSNASNSGNGGQDSNTDFNLQLDATVKAIAKQTYTGDAITPALTVQYQKVTLKAGTDYTVTYQDNKNVGTAKAVINGIGNYVGTKNVEFTIVPKKISKTAIEVYDATATGKEITPTVIIMDGNNKLEQETDYQITKLKNNTKPGKASITISGNGNYAGSTINKTFLIYKAGILPISSTEISLVDGQVPKEGFIYNGKAYKPEIVLKDVSGNTIDKKNYTVSYKNNKNAGTASVIVKGKGKVYKGSKTLYFTIQPKSIVKDYSIGKITEKKFTGGLITPTATVSLNGTKKKLVNKKEYSLSYENNLVAGTATVLVTGKGNYTGSLMSTFHIQAIPLGKGFSVKGLKTQKYTGSELKPAISLVYNNQTLVKERDYTVSYQSNVQIGKATVIIQAVEGSGLTGSMTKTFIIKK